MNTRARAYESTQVARRDLACVTEEGIAYVEKMGKAQRIITRILPEVDFLTMGRLAHGLVRDGFLD